jgi:hypothetical protein
VTDGRVLDDVFGALPDHTRRCEHRKDERRHEGPSPVPPAMRAGGRGRRSVVGFHTSAAHEEWLYTIAHGDAPVGAPKL